MTENLSMKKNLQDRIYFLTEILKTKVLLNGKKIGKLSDLVIVESSIIPEVIRLVITRPFGYPTLYVPFEKVESLKPEKIVISIESAAEYENEPGEEFVLLKDHILDKKVLDMEDKEVEVVYDIKMVLRNGKLYVTDVDFSRYGLLRRMGLKGLAYRIYNLAFMLGAKSLYSKKQSFFSNILFAIANEIKEKTIPWTYIQPLLTKMGRFKGDVKLKILKEKLSDISPIDLADILEELDHEQRVMIFEELDTEHASDTLEEINPNVQRELISSIKLEKAALLIDEMTPAQAADVLYALPSDEANEILKLLSEDNASKIKSILEKQEETILNYTTQDILKFSPDITADQAMDDFRLQAKGKDIIMYVYVVNEQGKLIGVVDIAELLMAKDNDLLKDIMTEDIISLNPYSTLKEASELFTRYGFRAIPVLDEDENLLGVIPYRDIMNLTHRFVE
jgi:magnesium transporter